MLSAQLARLHPSRTETNLTNARLPAETTTTQARHTRTQAIIEKHIHDDEQALGDREGQIGFERVPTGQQGALATEICLAWHRLMRQFTFTRS